MCRVLQGSVLGLLLFPFYMNDLPSVIEFLEIFLFADNTTYKQQHEFQTDLDSIGNWLKAIHLANNFEKQVNLISNIGLTFEIIGTQIESEPVCKYLGKYADFQLCFNIHTRMLFSRSSENNKELYLTYLLCAAQSIDTFL